MDRDMADALEALCNLLYLSRATLSKKPIADAYLARAEEVVQTIIRLAGRTPPGP